MNYLLKYAIIFAATLAGIFVMFWLYSRLPSVRREQFEKDYKQLRMLVGNGIKTKGGASFIADRFEKVRVNKYADQKRLNVLWEQYLTRWKKVIG